MYRVAIVGATGMVGQEFIRILQQRAFPIEELKLYASDRSAGRKITVNNTEIEVEETSEDSFKGIDLALFSAGADISLRFAPVAAKSGAVVVDNSAAWRMDPTVPLVVPEVNPEDAKKHNGIIANPNCSTIQMVVALHPLHKVNPIRRIVVDTYQAVSGTGLAAMEELNTEAKAVLDGRGTVPSVYPHQIAFNLLPEIDVFTENGYTKEEMKMVNETRKIMHAPDVQVSATTVRVPVFIGHSEALHVEFSKPITPDEVRAILAKSPGVVVQDDPTKHVYPQAWEAAGKDEVFVGRVRTDISAERSIAMWIVSDNIRKGAALNAIQIAEYLAAEKAL